MGTLPRTVDGNCVECHRIRALRDYVKNPEPIKSRVAQRYERRRVDDSDGIRAYGRAQMAAWRAAHPGASAAQARRWRKANPEKAREHDRKSDAKRDPVRRRQLARKRVAANPERYRAQLRAWCEANSDKVREWDRNKHARRRGAEGKHTAKDVAKLRAEQNDQCNICHVPLDGKGHVDHRIPIARGGTNWPDNLQLLCPTCNCSKGALLPEQFVARVQL